MTTTMTDTRTDTRPAATTTAPTTARTPVVAGARTTSAVPGPRWVGVCAVDRLEPAWGEAALVGGRQVALVRTADDEVFAVTHRDPRTGSCVMARGIVGSRGDRPTLASPLLKEVYDLRTGECFGDPELYLRTYRTRVVDGLVEVELAA